MKPRIYWSPVLRAWVVRPGGGWLATLCETWPQALAAIGIPCPDGWR